MPLPARALRCPAAYVALSLLLATAAGAQQHPAGHAAMMAPSVPTPPAPADSAQVPLYTVLGTFAWPVTTSVAAAQAYFNQGVRMMYAFTPKDARRSFAEARRQDPACAMCWWGEAWAMGPYLNGPMDDADAPAAHAAALQAQTLAAGASPGERALIDAMRVRYSPTNPAGGRKSLDSAFATAMSGVYAQAPGSLEVATLYADALMLLEPRRGTWLLARPEVQRIHTVLEGVLTRDLTHPGACHLYIHATETTPKAGLAQPCADLLGNALPGASHLNHMPSHTYNRVGRWGDATRANLQAWHSDQKAPRGEGLAIYPAHNLHMLLYAAAVDGQAAISVQAARDYAKIVPDQGDAFPALTLTRFGRFDEVLALAHPPSSAIHLGLWAFARGYAHLRLGHADSAAVYLTRVDSLARSIPADQVFRGHTPAHLLGIVGGILRGETLRAAGQTDAAVAALEAAVHHEDALVYDEPEPLPFQARDWLGAALLDAGRPADAERVFREGLEHRPRNGWSLLGIAQALRARGRTAEADAAQQEFERAWVRSDTWLPAPRF